MIEKTLAKAGMATIIAGVPTSYIAGQSCGRLVIVGGFLLILAAFVITIQAERKREKEEINKLKQ